MALGVLLPSSATLVVSAVVARLELGGTRATTGPLMAAAAMLGLLLPSALRGARGRHAD